MERFFEFQKIAEEEKVPLATYHLQGEVQLWYQIIKEEEKEVTWPLLKEGLNSKYGPTEFDDFFGDLTRLKQIGSVREYQIQFEKLLSRVGKLNQPQQVTCFVGGLKESMRIDIQAMKPTTLSATIGLAWLYEVKYQKQSNPNFELKRVALTSQTIRSHPPPSNPTI